MENINYQNRQRIGYLLISAIIIWLVFTFLIFPNLNLLKQTLMPDGALDLKPITAVFKSARVQKSLFNSLLLGLCLAITDNILGIFEILCLDYFEIKGRKWLNIAYHSPLICNGMVLVTAYYFMLGQDGFITANLLKIFPNLPPTWFIGFLPVLFEMTVSGTSNHILFVRSALNSIDYQTIEAAQNMGVKWTRILSKIVIPVLKPSIFAAAILGFITGITSFATPRVLGGPEFETINPLILSFSNTLTTRNYAAVLAIFLGILTIVVLSIFNSIESKGNYLSVSKVKTPLKRQKIENPMVNAIVTGLAHLFALIHVIPLVFIVIFSFMSVSSLYSGTIDIASFSLANYATVFNSVSGLKPVLTSLIYGFVAALIIVALMLFVARIVTKHKNKATQLLEFAMQIPWFLPGTLVALGIVMTFNKPSPLLLGMTLTGTLFALLIGYLITKTPYTFRMVKASYYALDGSLEEAAKNLGATPFSTFRKVIFPILLPAALSVFLLNFIGLLTEYDVSVFLFHPLYQPLGVALNAATMPEASPDARMLTFVYSVIVMIVSSIAIYMVYGRKGKKNHV